MDSASMEDLQQKNQTVTEFTITKNDNHVFDIYFNRMLKPLCDIRPRSRAEYTSH